MIVRKIKPQELKRANELCAIAFEYGEDNTPSPEEVLHTLKQNPRCRADLAWADRWAAFEDDDETMMSCLSVIPYPVHFDGHHTQMAGIGGVASLPPYRRKGGIRACFEKALPHLYESGVVFSYLYPFSTAYYRKFGYEMCCERNHYQLLMDKLPFTPLSGSSHLLEGGEQWLTDIQAVYRLWQERFNLMVIGQEMEFAWVGKANPVKDQQYSYLYRSADGAPKSYLTFQKVEEKSGRNLICSRFVFSDAEGFYGLINLLKSLAADHRYVSFDLPLGLFIEPLLPEWSMGAGTRQTQYWGMARVIRVREALEMARFRGNGHLTLEIRDPQIPQNNGIFSVSFQEGKATNVAPSDAAPDITLGIADFSRLVLGAGGTRMIPWLQEVHVHTSLEALSALLFEKEIYIGEYF